MTTHMIVDDDLPTVEQAAVLYALSQHVIGKIVEYESERGSRPDGAAIPRTLMTYGEMETMIPALLVVVVLAFPALNDEEYVAALVRGALGSRPN